MDRRRIPRWLGWTARWAVALALLFYAYVLSDRAAPPEPVTSDVGEISLPRALAVDVSQRGDHALWVDYRGVITLTTNGLHLELGGWGFLNQEVVSYVGVSGWGFGLAEPSPAGFAILAEHMIPAEHHYVTDRRDWAVKPPSSFDLVGIRKEDLARRWPLLIHELRVFLQPPQTGVGGSIVREYIHLPRETFADLLAERPWEN